MKLPDIPAIAIGLFGLVCLTQEVALPAFITDLASNAFVSTCLEGLAKYPTACTICLYIISVVFLLSGILRIWLGSDTARYLWGVGSAALAVLFMMMLNETVFGWAWTCDLYSAGTTEVVLTIFHFVWVFACPFAALYCAMMTSGNYSFTLPKPFRAFAMPFWIIPFCAVVGFLASLIPYAVLLLALIPLNYVFAVVDAIFIVLALLFVFLLLKLGVI